MSLHNHWVGEGGVVRQGCKEGCGVVGVILGSGWSYPSMIYLPKWMGGTSWPWPYLDDIVSPGLISMIS